MKQVVSLCLLPGDAGAWAEATKESFQDLRLSSKPLETTGIRGRLAAMAPLSFSCWSCCSVMVPARQFEVRVLPMGVRGRWHLSSDRAAMYFQDVNVFPC